MKKVHLLDIEKQIWSLEKTRVAFCNPKEIEIEKDYLETHSKPMWGELTLNDLAKRVGCVVGIGHAFVIVQGDMGCIGYSNNTGRLQEKSTVAPKDNIVRLK